MSCWEGERLCIIILPSQPFHILIIGQPLFSLYLSLYLYFKRNMAQKWHCNSVNIIERNYNQLKTHKPLIQITCVKQNLALQSGLVRYPLHGCAQTDLRGGLRSHRLASKRKCALSWHLKKNNKYINWCSRAMPSLPSLHPGFLPQWWALFGHWGFYRTQNNLEVSTLDFQHSTLLHSRCKFT